MCTRPFDQIIWSSFIYSFLVHATIRPKIRVLIDLFLLYCTTLRPSIRVAILSLCTTIRPKIRVFIDVFLLFAHNHSTKIYDRLSFIFFLCTTIRPKIRAVINFIFLFVHDHSINVRWVTLAL